MPVSPTSFPSALAAYTRAVDPARAAAAPPSSAPAPESFGDLLARSMSEAVATGDKAEASSLEALTGRVPLQDLVERVNAAEMSLQTVVAVRDRLITAYQEIMRMPI